MSDANTSLEELLEKFKPAFGQKVWGASLSFSRRGAISFELGNPLPPDEDGDINGEWHFRTRGCVWRLETDTDVVVASGDSREKIGSEIQQLENTVLLSVDISMPALETRMVFENGLVLGLFPDRTMGYEHWLFFMPNGIVITIGPGNEWSYEEYE